MVKKGSKQQNIVIDEEDQRCLDYLCIKLGLRPTQVYRLAIRAFYRSERKVD